MVQFYPWFKFYFPLFQTHYRTLPYPKTYKLERELRKYKVCEDAVRRSALANCTQLVSEMTDIVGCYVFASVCTPCCMLLRAVGSWCAKFKPVKRATCKRTQQLPASVCTGLQRAVGYVQSWPKGFGTQPLFEVFLNGICSKRAILTHKRGLGGGGGSTWNAFSSPEIQCHKHFDQDCS